VTLRVVALLPMKAHSERVSGKNFRAFHGKPLFRWVLDTLLAVPAISEVVINTDARTILADRGVQHLPRVTIRDRPEALRGDFVSMNRVLADDIANVAADLYVMTHTTNPLLTPRTLTDALGALAAGGAAHDSLFSVNKFQSRFYREDGSALNHDPTNLVRTQDLPPLYEENSVLYLFTAESFSRTSARIGARPILYPIPRIESIDIDDQESWEIAETLARGMKST
jgi:CMP-N-acetylneuraminic acid synthetase